MADGISCHSGGRAGYCDATIERRKGEHQESFMGRAGRAGWCIGHINGEAHYVCPDCTESVYQAVPLLNLRTDA